MLGGVFSRRGGNERRKEERIASTHMRKNGDSKSGAGGIPEETIIVRNMKGLLLGGEVQAAVWRGKGDEEVGGKG